MSTKLIRLIKSLNRNIFNDGYTLEGLMDWCNVQRLPDVSDTNAEIFYMLFNTIEQKGFTNF